MAIFDVFTSYHDHTCSFMDQEQDNITDQSLSLSTDVTDMVCILASSLAGSLDFIFPPAGVIGIKFHVKAVGSVPYSIVW